MTNEPTKALVWPSVVATEFVAARLADAVDPADVAAALRVMRAAAATDLRDLERKMTTDGLGNPIMVTEEQRHAQAAWSQANDLIDRASGWRDLLDLTDSIQQADVVDADPGPDVEDLEPSRVLCRFLVMKDGEMPKKYDPEVKARAVRMVREHMGDYGSVTAASVAVGAQLGIARESLRRWVAQADIDDGARPGMTSAESEEIRRLKAENKRLSEANAILRAASIFFAGELDSRGR